MCVGDLRKHLARLLEGRLTLTLLDGCHVVYLDAPFTQALHTTLNGVVGLDDDKHAASTVVCLLVAGGELLLLG